MEAAEIAGFEPASLGVLDPCEPGFNALFEGYDFLDRNPVAQATTEARRTELYELYLRRADRINTWDLVDLSGHHVVGGYLVDKPRTVLYDLARSSDWWERRLAIFATLPFVRRGEVDDTFAIAEILIRDLEDYVNKAVGGLLREAGKADPARLLDFLDRHAATAPRVTLRYAVERLDPPLRQHYLSLHKGQ